MTHENARRRWMRAATVAALSALAVGAEFTAPAQADPVVSTEAACTPEGLPTFGGPNGSVSWMTSSGVYVGGADTTNQWDDGSAVFAAAYWTHDAEGYHIHALPNDPLVDDDVLDVNENGRMIDYGYNLASDRRETWVFDLPTASWTRLPGLGGDTRGRRINASGLVSGGSDDQHRIRFPVTWTPPYTSVNKLSRNGVYPYASGNNDLGYSVGVAGRGRSTPAIDKDYQHLGPHQYGLLGIGIVWAPDGSQTTLPPLYSQSDPYDIDNSGVIVGASDTADPNTRHAVTWKRGVIRDIGGKAGWWTVARGISEGGWVAGGGDDGNAGQAFVWTNAGSLQWLPGLTPGGSSNGFAVNSTLRQVGGWAHRSDGSEPPTVWQCPVGFTTA